ncbi:ectonucleoside triphosphate diphosphohydrolase 8-like [Rhinophrynus dorsalis]
MVAVSKHHSLLVLLVISLVSIIIALVLSLIRIGDVSLPPKTKYGMVFDAGSSHTSLFIYQWPTDKQNSTGIVSQTHVCDVEGGGISSYANDPPGAGKSLLQCMDKAMSIIPPDSQKETPTYLGATAGMRLLRLENASVADKVLSEVSKTIRGYPVDFRGARIITGEEEGVYGWITINYLLESFMKYSLTGQWMRPISSKIYGALDLGGASTQISFIPTVNIADPKEKADFRLYGFPYTIYTHSFLCYGQNQALLQMLVKAVVGQDLTKPISIPCYPKGYEENITVQSLYNSPCTAAAAQPSSQSQVTLQGTGNFTQCLPLIKSIFNFTACGSQAACSFDGVYQPPVTGSFLAFSSFFYTLDFLNMTAGQSLATVTNAIERLCARDWTELQSSYPNMKKVYVRDYCATSIYIVTLLLDAYKFTADTWNSISFQKKAGDADIGWTLGYMLNLTNMIPSESAVMVKAQSSSVWAAAIFFIVLSLAVILLVLLVNFL